MNTQEKIDIRLLVVIGSLIAFGLLMLFSASIYENSQPNFYINNQLKYLAISLVAGFIIFKISTRTLEFYSPHLFGFTLVLLLLVFFPFIGGEIKGSYRWIQLPGFNFQPSELLKLSMILFMAGYLVRREDKLQKGLSGFFVAIGIVLVVGLLLLLETDVGAFLIVAITALTMLWIAHVGVKPFAAVILGGAVLMSFIVYLLPERMARITAFWDPWSDPYGKSYQLIQSLIAIGSGELKGVGLGASVQKVHFLPDAHTDFIFAVIGEELGVIGMLSILFLFTYVIYKGFVISQTAINQGAKYDSYVAFGISVWFALQITVNIGVNVGLLPTKGLTLPLFSYGGSSMLVSIIALSILLRIDAQSKRINYHKRKI